MKANIMNVLIILLSMTSAVIEGHKKSLMFILTLTYVLMDICLFLFLSTTRLKKSPSVHPYENLRKFFKHINLVTDFDKKLYQ